MKLYTRTGDAGKTSIIGGRVMKDDPRLEAYGTIDELNSFVGAAAAGIPDSDAALSDLKGRLLEIMHELFDCGSDLARVNAEPGQFKVNPAMVERLEQWIDEFEAENPPIRRFILPGGSELSARLHICRTVCRRAERRVVTLAAQAEINETTATYLNRLSDLLFSMARAANHRLGVTDVEYVRSANVFGSDK